MRTKEYYLYVLKVYGTISLVCTILYTSVVGNNSLYYFNRNHFADEERELVFLTTRVK